MKLTILLSLAGLALGLAVMFEIASQFESTALVAFEDRTLPGAPRGPSPTERFITANAELTSRTYISSLIQSRNLNLYDKERKGTPIEDIAQRVRTRDLHLELLHADAKTALFRIRFRYPDRVKAAAMVQAIITHLFDEDLQQARVRASAAMDHLDVLEQRVAAIEKHRGKPAPYSPQAAPVRPIGINTIDPPSIPQTPVVPNRALIALAGLGMGAFAGVFISRSRA